MQWNSCGGPGALRDTWAIGALLVMKAEADAGALPPRYKTTRHLA